MRVFFSFCFVFKLLWRKEERVGRGGEREREGENGDRILEMRTVHKGEFPFSYRGSF